MFRAAREFAAQNGKTLAVEGGMTEPCVFGGCFTRNSPARETMKLKGKTVLITGGGSGLGREMGLLFASEGAKIGVNDIRSESAHNVATEIERAGESARPLVADVSNSAAVKKMFADFLATFSTIDILINNAGIARTRDETSLVTTAEMADEDWDKMLSTHSQFWHPRC